MAMTSDEEKRWMVVGVAMVKVIAPVLRDTVKQGMALHYSKLDASLPCNLNALTLTDVSKTSSLKNLKFGNINKNSQIPGKDKKKYNYNVSSDVDLAKLYLPEYLAAFSAFDESLDLSAILRLLGCTKPAVIFPSPDPRLSIQTAADDVRDDIRNRWAHANINDWTDTFFNDCFLKLENLVKSVGLGVKEKSTLDQLHEWQSKGCQRVLGNAVDQQLLALVRQDFAAMQATVASLEGTVENQQQRLDEVEAHHAKYAKEMDDVMEMTENLKAQLRPESPPKRPFNLETFCIKLKDHYTRTATVQTSVWSAKSKVNIREVYTRLSMLKENQSVPVDYKELFKKMKNGLEPQRILVVGQAGIGKSTFVTKLCLDWVEHEETSVSEEERNLLKKFQLVLHIKLRDVSHCKTLKEIIRCSDLLPEEDKDLTGDLLRYITENQEQVLFVFDGYDEYGMGNDSDVFNIFKGDKLRNCSVMVTSRSSQGDDLREFAEVQAEVTGFSLEDIKQYLVKQLGKEEAEALLQHLKKQRLIDTAKVPILSLFFSILWTKMREKFTAKNRTMVFWEVVQCILDYGHGKGASDQHRTVENSGEVLVELGRVALEALLTDDLLFEYGKLAQIKGCDGIIQGFLQITEDTENIRPTERVSFIHKTIQEFLAAWFIVYKCTPNGDLGRLQEHVRDFESCLRFENVLQFISGLSHDGAVLVLQRLAAVKLGDPTLHFMETVVLPGTSKQTCYDLTNRQKRFHDLVFASFDEAKSKEGLLRHCVLCTDGVMILSERLVGNLLECNDVISENPSGVLIFKMLKNDLQYSLGENLRVFLDRLDVAVKVTESSEALQLGDFYRKFLNCGFLCMCNFSAVLVAKEGSLSFYITDLLVACDLHEHLFTGFTVDYHPFHIHIAEDCEDINQNQERRKSLRLEHLAPLKFPFERQSKARSLLNEQTELLSLEYSLKHLQSLECVSTSSSEILYALGVIAGKSKYFNSVDLRLGERGNVCDFLEQVKNLNNGSLKLSIESSLTCTPAGAYRLSNLLPIFNNLSVLSLNLRHCSDDLVSNLVAAITHTTLSKLCLTEVDLVENAAVVLGQSVCRMSALKVLVINGKNNDLGFPGMQALFGRFSREMPLRELELSCFRVSKDGLTFLRKSFKFFRRLADLWLINLGMDVVDVCYLIDDVSFPELHKLDLSRNQLGNGITSIVSHIVRLPKIFQLVLSDAGCSLEDVKYIIENVRMVQPVFGVCSEFSLELYQIEARGEVC